MAYWSPQWISCFCLDKILTRVDRTTGREIRKNIVVSAIKHVWLVLTNWNDRLLTSITVMSSCLREKTKPCFFTHALMALAMSPTLWIKLSFIVRSWNEERHMNTRRRNTQHHKTDKRNKWKKDLGQEAKYKENWIIAFSKLSRMQTSPTASDWA